jgi:hypothetical protein
MTQYFVMRALPSPDDVEGYMDIEDWDATEGFGDWSVGKLAQQRPTGSVQINAVPNDGYQGEPADLQDLNVPIMSKRLKAAMDAAGVDNINYLPITLKNTETGQVYDYFAFNLLGLVSAADRAQSKMASYDGDFVGDSQVYDLVIDESKCGGLLMFRLKEKFSAVIVHEKVKKAVEAAGIDTVAFMNPKDYMAL